MNSSNDAETSNDAQIEYLGNLFRELLGGIISAAKLDQPDQTETLRKKLFGITKGLSRDIGPNNPLDYEQKYPKDEPEEVLADNARVWLTYLDEAGAYDRDKVEGWKDTVDVLLVFAGLFSGVITTFVSQASSSLQQDYTQVSASLMFEMLQLQRAQFSGTPISDVPTSTLIPNSPFKPTTNILLVNGLWFSSLAISLATALVAVLTKQWLYYYMSAISGTAIEKVRLRHFRFRGLEVWKVGLIIDLLPIFLHLALGIFLVGIIIFLFPLDSQIAWTIVAITGVTFTLYFISVILPIRYPDCPYTTSLATFAGNVFYFLSDTIHLCSDYFERSLYFQNLWQRVLYWKKWHKRVSRIGKVHGENCTITTPIPTPTPFSVSLCTPTPASRIHGNFHGFADQLNKAKEANLTNWRERNLNKVIQADSGLIELKALEWLHTISSNPSIRRIVAWGVSVHPGPVKELSNTCLEKISIDLRVDGNDKHIDLQYLRHRLCMDFQKGSATPWSYYWWNFEKMPNQVVKQYQDYTRLAADVANRNYSQVLMTALVERLKLPPVIWRGILKMAPKDATLVACVLASRSSYPFRWGYANSNLVSNPSYETGDVSFDVEQLDRWVFDYLLDYFWPNTQLDCPSKNSAFEARYRLFVSIYRNLISDKPIITDEAKRKHLLNVLFKNFYNSLSRYPPQCISPEWPLAFFMDISCVWHPNVELPTRDYLTVDHQAKIQEKLLIASGPRCFLIRCQYEDISFICDWFSRVIYIPVDSIYVIGSILFMPQNRVHLLKKISGSDFHPTALSNLCKCLHTFKFLGWQSYHEVLQIKRKYIYPNLMHLFRTKYGTGSERLVENLYDFSVLAEIWEYLVKSPQSDEKEFFQIIKSRLGPQKSAEFVARTKRGLKKEPWDHDGLLRSANQFQHTLTICPAPNSIFISKVPDLFSKALCRRRDIDVETGGQELDPIEAPFKQ